MYHGGKAFPLELCKVISAHLFRPLVEVYEISLPVQRPDHVVGMLDHGAVFFLGNLQCFFYNLALGDVARVDYDA